MFCCLGFYVVIHWVEWNEINQGTNNIGLHPTMLPSSCSQSICYRVLSIYQLQTFSSSIFSSIILTSSKGSSRLCKIWYTLLWWRTSRVTVSINKGAFIGHFKLVWASMSSMQDLCVCFKNIKRVPQQYDKTCLIVHMSNIDTFTKEAGFC